MKVENFGLNSNIFNSLRHMNGNLHPLIFWKPKFGGMDASMMKRLKELEEENKRLKKMYAEERLKAEIRQEALEGKL